MQSDTLARYPYPIVRVACRYCKRRGRYRIEQLVERFGPEASLEEVLRNLSADCALSFNRTGRHGCQGAYLPDVERRTAWRR